MTVADRIKFVRTKLFRMTQLEFAKRLAISPSFLSRFERPLIKEIDKAKIKLIAKEFSIHEDFLLQGKGRLFADEERGVELLVKKNKIENKYEAYFIFDLCQQVCASPSLQYLVVLKEYVYDLYNLLCEIYSNHIENKNEYLPYLKLNIIEKSLQFYQNSTVPVSLLQEILASFSSLFMLKQQEPDDFPSEVYEKITKICQKYLFYVSKACVLYKKKNLFPMSSVHIPFPLESSESSEEFKMFQFKIGNVLLQFSGRVLLRFLTDAESNNDKFSFLIPLEKLYAFFSRSKVLDYEFHYFDNKLSIKQSSESEIAIVLEQEKENYIKLFESIPEDVKKYLAKLYADKYGFI